jgi:hypothetical protein
LSDGSIILQGKQFDRLITFHSSIHTFKTHVAHTKNGVALSIFLCDY